MPSRSVFVTGANGFIGRHVCIRLSQQGFDVLAGVRTRGDDATGKAWRTLETSDLAENTQLHTALEGVDAIVHLAGRAHVLRESAHNPQLAFARANVDATVQLARAAVAARVRRFVFVSSIGVHGDRASHRLTETDVPAPAEPYAASKLRAEQALRDIVQNSGAEFVIVRPTLVYGPLCPGNLARLAKLVRLGLPLPLAGFNSMRSLVGVDNLASLLQLAITHPAAANSVFLAADGQDVSLSQLIGYLATGMGRPTRVFAFPRAPIALAARLLGQAAALDKLTASLCVDVGKAKTLLGWQPEVSVAQGLRETGRSFAQAHANR